MGDDLTKVAQDSARGGFFLISGAAIATVISAIASILIARFLGPELYGQYALALVAPQILYLFTDLGLVMAIIKFAAALKSDNETDRIPKIIEHTMFVRAAIGLTIFVLNYAFADAIAIYFLQRPELSFFIQIASISILFQVISTTATSAFVGLDKTEYKAIITNTQAVAKAIGSVALILAGLSIVGAVVGYTLSYIVSGLMSLPLLWLILRGSKTSRKGYGLKANLKMLFKYGSPLYVSVLISGFLPLFKNVILAYLVSDTEIGNYKAAINFAALLIILADPITTILLPAFSKLNQTYNQKIQDFFHIALKYTTIITVPVVSLIIIFSTEIVTIIYGSTYQLASLLLSTNALSYLLVGIGYLTLPSLYNGLGETKITLKMNLITFFVLSVLAVPLTQSYGAQGIIIASLISLLLGTLYGAYIAKKNYQVEFNIKNMAKIYMVSVIASILPFLLNNFSKLPNLISLVLGSLLYLFIFITFMPLTDVVSLLELEKITLAIRKAPFLRQIAGPIIKYQQRILKIKAKLKNRQRV